MSVFRFKKDPKELKMEIVYEVRKILMKNIPDSLFIRFKIPG